jgi:hypothetical protein
MILRVFFSYDTQWASNGYNLLNIMGKNNKLCGTFQNMEHLQMNI